MKELPAISGQECVSKLMEARFELVGLQDDHMILWREHPQQHLTVPDHARLDRSTLRVILRYAGITEAQWRLLNVPEAAVTGMEWAAMGVGLALAAIAWLVYQYTPYADLAVALVVMGVAPFVVMAVKWRLGRLYPSQPRGMALFAAEVVIIAVAAGLQHHQFPSAIFTLLGIAGMIVLVVIRMKEATMWVDRRPAPLTPLRIVWLVICGLFALGFLALAGGMAYGSYLFLRGVDGPPPAALGMAAIGIAAAVVAWYLVRLGRE